MKRSLTLEPGDKDQGHTTLKIDSDEGLAEASFATPLGRVGFLCCSAPLVLFNVLGAV